MARAAALRRRQHTVKTNYLPIRVCTILIARDIIASHVVANVRTLVFVRPCVGTIAPAVPRTIDIAGHRYGLNLGTCHSCLVFVAIIEEAG